MGEVQVIIEHLKLLSVDITTTFLINQYKKTKTKCEKHFDEYWRFKTLFFKLEIPTKRNE